MTDPGLQKRYVVTWLQPLLAYNAPMSRPARQQTVEAPPWTRRAASQRWPGARFRWASVLAVALLAVVALAAACGGGPSSSSGAVSTRSASYQQALGYAHCMRSHGLTSFPDPKPGANLNVHGPVGKPDSPAARANAACEHLLSTTGTGASSTTVPATPNPPSAVADCLAVSQCYAPRQFLVAYGIQPLIARGITGYGVTVVLPEEAETGPPRPQSVAGIGKSVTDIRSDLADFDRRFGLPSAHLQVITTLAGSSASPWLAGVEEVEDTELVHAVAPDATIRELLVDPAGVSTPGKAASTVATYVRTAAKDGEVMSQSGVGQDFNVGESTWTSAEVATMNSALAYAATRHLTVVVASGDYGVIGDGSSSPTKEVSLPASDPWALAVGGTTLTANPTTGAYESETAWNVQSGAPDGSGGGFSRLFARPGYQKGVPGIGATRGVPDVAGEATGTSGMALVFSAPGGSQVLLGAGGTSAAAPFWAGLIALADQEAGRPLGFVNPAIYRIAQSPQYHQAFHDITTGTNTVTLGGTTITGYQAGLGWDPVTGWGTPDAQVLIPLLARDASH
jgi:subtilase family serine protease